MEKRKSTNCPICQKLMKVFTSDLLMSGVKASSQECFSCNKRWVVHGTKIIRECKTKNTRTDIDQQKWLEAKKNGEMFYFTGIPCRKGHISKIYTLSRYCTQCRQDSNKDRLEAERQRCKSRKKIENGEKLERKVIYGGSVEIPKPKSELEAFLYG